MLNIRDKPHGFAAERRGALIHSIIFCGFGFRQNFASGWGGPPQLQM